MHILAIEPYYGGSHRAFLDGWRRRSRHDFTVLHLPPYKWKWRMRHAPITIAEQIRELPAEGQNWDVLFCSDMLNLAEFLGLADAQVSALPRIAYFHENQWTYPTTRPHERDYHYGFSNLTTALAANEVWFNSEFHRDDFLFATKGFLRRMPDFQSLGALDQIRAKSSVAYPGVDIPPPRRSPRTVGPLRILWAARWEHDKDPQTFFSVIEKLANRNLSFRLSVIGQSFADVPPVFDQARRQFDKLVDHWGYQESAEDYRAVLEQADVVVSTAQHEFFGVSVVEAIAGGSYPILPNRLAYPELLDLAGQPTHQRFFYDGSASALVDKLTSLATQLANGVELTHLCGSVQKEIKKLDWRRLVETMDHRIQNLASAVENA